MQAQVEELTGQAGLHILRAILENEVTHRVGLRISPIPARTVCTGESSRVTWFFGGQKIPLERPRVVVLTVRNRDSRQLPQNATLPWEKSGEGSWALIIIMKTRAQYSGSQLKSLS
jgi:hypothetical protein